MFNVTQDHTSSTQNSDMMHDGAQIVACHGLDRFLVHAMLQMKGYLASRKLNVISPIDEIISHGHRQSGMHPFDCFICMFLQTFFPSLGAYENTWTNTKDVCVTRRGELLEFLAILFLVTRCEFTGSKSLRSQKLTRNYLHWPVFGQIISHPRFEDLRRSLSFPPNGNVSKTNRWTPFMEFIDVGNEHHSSEIIPSDRTPIDGSMWRYHVLRGGIESASNCAIAWQ